MKRRIFLYSKFCQKKIPFLILSFLNIILRNRFLLQATWSFLFRKVSNICFARSQNKKNGHSSLVLSRNLIWSIHVDYFSVPQWAIIRSTFHFSKRSFYLEIQNMCLFLWFLMFPKAERRI